MTSFSLVAVAALSIVAFASGLRALLQTPRLPIAPNAPTLECALYDLIAGMAALRAWVIFERRQEIGFTEMSLMVVWAAAAALGLVKVLIYARR